MRTIFICLLSASVLCFSGCNKTDNNKTEQVDKQKKGANNMKTPWVPSPNPADYKDRI